MVDMMFYLPSPEFAEFPRDFGFSMAVDETRPDVTRRRQNGNNPFRDDTRKEQTP
jgi:hypothetical protein